MLEGRTNEKAYTRARARADERTRTRESLLLFGEQTDGGEETTRDPQRHAITEESRRRKKAAFFHVYRPVRGRVC